MNGIALTTRQTADQIGQAHGRAIEEWKIRRLFEDGTLPEPVKFGGKRVILPEMVPHITEALRDRGWLTPRVAS